MPRHSTGPTLVVTPGGPEGIEAILAVARELTAVSSLAELRFAIDSSLQLLLPSRDISILRASRGIWESVLGPEDARDRLSQYSWTPLVADGETIGMLGFGVPASKAPTGKTAEGVTTLLALAAQNLLSIEMLRHETLRDGLTGCFNRAYALEVIEGNLRRARRTGLPDPYS